MPVAAIVGGVVGVGGDALDQVQRELGDVRLAVRERGLGGRTRRVGARAQRGEPARLLLRPVDPAGEALRVAAAVDHVDRARVGQRRARAGRRAPPPPPPARRPARCARRPRAARTPRPSRAPSAPGRPRRAWRRSSRARCRRRAARAGPPARPGGRSSAARGPSPGESARGCIPRPLSVTVTVSSSAPVAQTTRTMPRLTTDEGVQDGVGHRLGDGQREVDDLLGARRHAPARTPSPGRG